MIAARSLMAAQHGCAQGLTLGPVFERSVSYWSRCAADVEPVSGIEPLTCRLQEVRPQAPCALAAQMARIIALTAVTTLGLSGAPVHEPVHARGSDVPPSCYSA